MTVIDNAIYVDGRRVSSPKTLARTREALGEHGGFAWIGLYRPSEEQFAIVAREFDLHPLAVEDALAGHQRAKLERYGDTWFVVLRPARYLDAEERVEVGEIEMFVGDDFIIVTRNAEMPDFAQVRRRLEAAPDLLARGTLGVLYALFDQVVDEYSPVVAGLENDIDEIEAQLFAGDPDVTRRIYDLSREVMDVQRAIKPLAGMITQLRVELEAKGGDDSVLLEVRRSFRDVFDHVLEVSEKIDEFRHTLQNALMTRATLVAQEQADRAGVQSEQSKKVAGWAAIIFAPSLVTGIYGMNFEFMPELDEPWGYPLALGLMVLSAGTLFAIFRSRRWI